MLICTLPIWTIYIMRTPPFKDDSTYLATIYLHFVRLHAWLFWTDGLWKLARAAGVTLDLRAVGISNAGLALR